MKITNELTVRELLNYMFDIQKKPKVSDVSIEIFGDCSGQFKHHTGITFSEFYDIEDLIDLIRKDENA